MENHSTKNTVLSNLIWRFLERCGAQMVSFVVSIVLARILSPDEYGTIALVTVFITILQVFVDSGLGNSLIQKKDSDEVDFSTVFYTNLMFCIFLYGVIYLCAPLIGLFYEDMSLVPIIRVLSITILVSGVKNVQQAYVAKHMMFKKFFFSTIGGTIFAAILGVLFAINGFGIWALVAQQLSNVIIDTCILWITVKWRPKKIFSIKRLMTLYSYGWKLLVSALLDNVYNNIRQLVIGKLYTTEDLAFYNKGMQFPNLIVLNVNTSIDSVLLPAMSQVQDQGEKLKAMTRRSIKTSIYIMAPLMMGLAFVAPSLIEVLLTEKWLPCVFYMRIFCITYMFYPVHTANLNAIKAMGRSDLFLKLEIYKKIVGVILLISTMWIGVEAMAYSLLISCIFSQIINTWPNKKLLNYGYIEQLKDILPSIALAVAMGCIVLPIELFDLPAIATLFFQAMLGVVVYIVGSAIFKNESYRYLLEIINKKIRKK